MKELYTMSEISEFKTNDVVGTLTTSNWVTDED